jgi:hypothetical protein
MNLRACALAAALAAAIANASAAGGHEIWETIPSDAWFAAWAQDPVALRTQWADSAAGRVWQSSSLDGLRKQLEGDFASAFNEFSDRSQLRTDELWEEVKGPVAIFSTRFAPDHSGGDRRPKADLVIALEHKPEQRESLQRMVDRIAAKAPGNARKSTDTVAGTEVRAIEFTIDEPDPRNPGMLVQNKIRFEYAFAEGVLLVGHGTERPLRKALETRTTGNGTLAGEQRFRAVFDLVTVPRDVMLYLDTDRLGEGLEKTPRSGETTGKIWSATGLRGQGPLLLALFAKEGRAGAQLAMRRAAEPKGLFAISGTERIDVAGALARVPGNSDSFTVFALSGANLWREVRSAIAMFQPNMLGIVDAYLGTSRSQYGIDPVNDVIVNLAGAHAIYQVPGESPTAPPRWVARLGLQNASTVAESLARAVETMKTRPDNLFPIESSEIDGTRYYWLKPMAPGMPDAAPRFAVTTDSILVAATEGLLREAIGRTATATGGALEKPLVRAELERADRAALNGFGFTGETTILASLATAKENLRQQLERTPKARAEFEMMPDPEGLRGRLGNLVSTREEKPSATVFRLELIAP